MAHFAQIDQNNIVVSVLVIEQDQIDTGLLGDPSRWIQTSYNTRCGEHLAGGTPLRKNYAGPGMIYDPIRDAFYVPQPYPSWTLNEYTCQWEPPVPRPEGYYVWNEPTLEWLPDNTTSENQDGN
jgi:hypothetical protein